MDKKTNMGQEGLMPAVSLVSSEISIKMPVKNNLILKDA
jgi:hypothetical protein